MGLHFFRVDFDTVRRAPAAQQGIEPLDFMEPQQMSHRHRMDASRVRLFQRSR